MNRKIAGAGIALLSMATLASATVKLDTDEQKILYALGVATGQRLAQYQITGEDAALVEAGFADGMSGAKSQVPLEEWGPRIGELLNQRLSKVAEKEKEAGAAFLAKMAKEKGARKTESGLIFIPIKEGTGKSPSATSRVKVHYHGTLRDGTVFDSSVDRGEPATFALDRVIAGWTEGLQLMKEGGKAKLVCPPDLAYGDRGAGGRIPPGATLVFDVELLEVLDD